MYIYLHIIEDCIRELMPHFSELSAFNMGANYIIYILFCIFWCSYPFSSANIFWAMQDNLCQS